MSLKPVGAALVDDLEGALEHRGERRGHADRVHADAEGRVVDRGVLGQALHGVLGGDVGRRAAEAADARDGGDVDDRRRRVLLHQLPELVAQRVERAVDVHLDDAVASSRRPPRRSAPSRGPSG